MKIFLFFSILASFPITLSGCSAKEDLLLVDVDKKYADISGYCKISLKSNGEFLCVAPWKIKVIQAINDPSLKVSGGGGGESKFYGAIALDEPIYMIGATGFSFFVLPSEKEQDISLPYVKCEDILNKNTVKEKVVKFNL